jgi:hypothetical protein
MAGEQVGAIGRTVVKERVVSNRGNRGDAGGQQRLLQEAGGKGSSSSRSIADQDARLGNRWLNASRGGGVGIARNGPDKLEE